MDGWERCVHVLLDNGADPFARDSKGKTPRERLPPDARARGVLQDFIQKKEAAAEADAVRRLQRGEVATLEGVYAVLRRLSRSDQEPFPPSVSVRPRASPFAAFASDHDAFFVSRERAPPVTGPPQTNTVSVAFQSPLNGECWWDPLSPANGVCARPMARRYRSGESAGQVHGYRGRQYTLVQRRLPDGPAAAGPRRRGPGDINEIRTPPPPAGAVSWGRCCVYATPRYTDSRASQSQRPAAEETKETKFNLKISKNEEI